MVRKIFLGLMVALLALSAVGPTSFAAETSYIGSVVKLKKPKEDVKIIALDILNQKVKVVLTNGESLVVNVAEINS